ILLLLYPPRWSDGMRLDQNLSAGLYPRRHNTSVTCSSMLFASVYALMCRSGLACQAAWILLPLFVPHIGFCRAGKLAVHTKRSQLVRTSSFSTNANSLTTSSLRRKFKATLSFLQ